MPDPYPFVYQCRQCGAVRRVTRADAEEVADRERPRLTADVALRELYGWAQARPDSVCAACGP
jgi:hypothetical protein